MLFDEVASAVSLDCEWPDKMNLPRLPTESGVRWDLELGRVSQVL